MSEVESTTARRDWAIIAIAAVVGMAVTFLVDGGFWVDVGVMAVATLLTAGALVTIARRRRMPSRPPRRP